MSTMSKRQPTRTSRAKEIAAAVGISWLVLAAGLTLALLTAIVVAVGTGASPDDAFHEATVIPESLSGRVIWLPAAVDLPRSVEPSTQEAVEGTWVRAFGDLELVAEGHDDVALETWFIGRALQTAWALESGTKSSITSTAVRHQIVVTFYSADGQVLSLSSATTIERERTGVGGSASVSETVTEQFQALLILSDGNWRIEQFIRGGQP